MVIAMLTLPSGTAGFASKNLAGMMIVGTILSAVFTVTGLAASWSLDMPAGAMVVVLAGAVFLAVSAAAAAKASSTRGSRRPARVVVR